MQRRLAGLLFAFAAVFLAGCGGSGGGNSLPDPNVRLFHMAADAPALDFKFNDTTRLGGATFTGSTADFQAVSPDTVDVRILESGTTNEIWSEVLTHARDRDYIIAAYGLFNYGAEPEKRLVVNQYEFDRTAPAGNKARLIIHHGYNRSVGNQTPNIDFQNPGQNPQFRAANIQFGAVSTLLVDSGNQTFEVRPNESQFVIVSSTQALAPGAIYAVFITGIEGGTGGQAPAIRYVQLTTRN